MARRRRLRSFVAAPEVVVRDVWLFGRLKEREPLLTTAGAHIPVHVRDPGHYFETPAEHLSTPHFVGCRALLLYQTLNLAEDLSNVRGYVRAARQPRHEGAGSQLLPENRADLRRPHLQQQGHLTLPYRARKKSGCHKHEPDNADSTRSE